MRLEGTYRRRYNDAALGIGKTDYISFTADSRFQERGFLAAALGSQILPNGRVVFFDSEAGGEGTFSLSPETLELNYTSNSYRGEHQVGGGAIRLSFYPLDRIAGTNVVTAAILNTHYTFVRLSTDAQGGTSSAAGTNQPDPRDIKPARSRVEGVLKRVLGLEHVPVDGYGNWALQFGSAVYFIRLLPMLGSDKHIVQVFSPMVSGVTYSPPLMDAINWINAQILFGRVAWMNGVLFAFSELVAETVDELELRVACNTISTVADRYDNALQSQFGGQISFPPLVQKPAEPTPIQTPEEKSVGREEDRRSLAELLERHREISRMIELLESHASDWQPLKS